MKLSDNQGAGLAGIGILLILGAVAFVQDGSKAKLVGGIIIVVGLMCLAKLAASMRK